MAKTDGIIAEFRAFRDVMNTTTTTPSTTTTTRNTNVEDALTKIAENSNKIFQAIDNLNPAKINLDIINKSGMCIQLYVFRLMKH